MSEIVIFGCKHTTKEFISRFRSDFPEVNLFVITIDSETAEKNHVAGFYDLTEYLQVNGLRYLCVSDYSLKNSKSILNDLKVFPVCGFCIGWQRLIPSEILAQFPRGVYGMHGSNKPLPHGRGRSPLNWSLILGRKIFYTHLFRYNPGVDDGDIVGVQTFEINIHDTALTLHYKNLISMLMLVKVHLHGIIHDTVKLVPQNHAMASFFPKRTAEDGLINWFLSAHDIYNLIRGVTFPFPGAFSYINNIKVVIWSANPFDSILSFDHSTVGQICMVFENGDFIVKTGDIPLLVTEYELADKESQILEGDCFHNGSIKLKNWSNLPI